MGGLDPPIQGKLNSLCLWLWMAGSEAGHGDGEGLPVRRNILHFAELDQAVMRAFAAKA
jgi:hypothetical protein